jgi:hypothetical protein
MIKMAENDETEILVTVRRDSQRDPPNLRLSHQVGIPDLAVSAAFGFLTSTVSESFSPETPFAVG